MITVNLTYAAFELPTGLHRVHLYVEQENDNGFDMSPREERHAIKDAELIVRDIVRVNNPNEKNDERLLREGSPDESAIVVCRAKVIVRWDRKLKMATYHNGGHERYLWDSKWHPVATLMMEQLDYTLKILRNRERAERKNRLEK